MQLSFSNPYIDHLFTRDKGIVLLLMAHMLHREHSVDCVDSAEFVFVFFVLNYYVF